MVKENDWIVANINNPEFNSNDFKDVGFTTGNTQLLSKDEYLKSQFIKDKFSDENGNFDKQAFDNFYAAKALDFAQFSLPSQHKTMTYDYYNTHRQLNDKVMDNNFRFETVANPDRQTIGVNSRNAIGKRTLSRLELAQTQQIFDPEKGEWTEHTVNDAALFKSPVKWFKELFSEPLVMALYDEDSDEIDSFTGRMVHHNKGDYKTNKFGTYYTERLNGRSLIGKETISAFDTLTVDGEGINKYDFFDSDDIDKSVGGTIAKSVATLIPLFLAPEVAAVYGGALVAKETLKTLPMLQGMIGSWFNVEDSKILNNLAAFGSKMSLGLSESSKESLVNAEMLCNLITDVALQWSQQKFIALSILKLKGGKNLMDEAMRNANASYLIQRALMELDLARGVISKHTFDSYVGTLEKWTESAVGSSAIKFYTKDVENILKAQAKFGGDASLVYMALVSNTDVYNDMLEAGASKKEAAAVALGSTLGMFAVDKYTHLGEIFFDEETSLTERAIRGTFKKNIRSWRDFLKNEMKGEAPVESVAGLKKIINKAKQFGQETTNQFIEDLQYHSLSFLGKAVGEGLEEVGEELVSDAFKSIYELAGEFGFNTSTKNVGAWDNMLERYGMSFLGGAVGGGLFYGVDVYNNGFSSKQQEQELMYLIRNGKTKEALDMLEEWHDLGKLGNTELSYKTLDVDGKKVFITPTDGDSQNDFVYNLIKAEIMQLEAIINENGMNLSDSELFQLMILSEARFNNLKNYLDVEKISYTTGYQREFQNLIGDIRTKDQQIEKAQQTKSGTYYKEGIPENDKITDEWLRDTKNNQAVAQREANLKKLYDEKEKLIEKRDLFLTGLLSLPYTEKMLFFIDKTLHDAYLIATFTDYVREFFDGRDPDDLSSAEYEKAHKDYLEFKKNEQPAHLSTAFQRYKALEKMMNPAYSQLSNDLQLFKDSKARVEEFEKNNPLRGLRLYKFDDILDFSGETENSDSYINRGNEESNQDRVNLINQENQRILQTVKQQFDDFITKSGGHIDSATKRRFQLLLKSRVKDYNQQLIDTLSEILDDVEFNVKNSGSLKKALKDLLNSINLDDLSNFDLVVDLIEKAIKDTYKALIIESNTFINKFSDYVASVFPDPDDPDVGLDIQFGTGLGNGLYVFLNGQFEQLKQIITDKLNEKGITLSDDELNTKTLDALFDSTSEEEVIHDSFSKDFVHVDDSGSVSLDISPLMLKGWNSIGSDNIPKLAALLQELKDVYRRQSSGDASADVGSFVKLVSDTQAAVDSDSDLNNLIADIKNLIMEEKSRSEANPLKKIVQDIHDKVADINPGLTLVKQLAIKLGKNSKNLEHMLERLSKRFEDLNDVNDLLLLDEEELAFDEAATLILMVLALIYAMSTKPSYLSPVGHNRSLREFAEAHNDIYTLNDTDYPTLEPDIADALIYELQGYLTEMGIADENGKYSINSWRGFSNENKVNKALQLLRADNAWKKTVYSWLSNNRDGFKLLVNGKDVDLLKGFETIPLPNDTNRGYILNKIFDLYYDNLLAALTSGIDYSDILTKLIPNVCDHPDEIYRQKTSILDETLSPSNYTDFDKLQLLNTIGALKSTEFVKFLKKNIDELGDIAPITIQEYAQRIMCAAVNNIDLFNKSIDYIASMNPNRPMVKLKNMVYLSGDAGGGKTSVCIRNACRFIKPDDEIWISAPKESLVTTLKESVGRGTAKIIRGDSNNELFESIMDEEQYNKIIKDLDSINTAIESGSEEKTSEYFSLTKNNESKNIPVVDFNKITWKNVDKKPKIIAIDEVTHLSNVELQILTKWANDNNVILLVCGDDKQNGDSRLVLNIRREASYVVRTPCLGISLRDNNIQHTYNNNVVGRIITKISNMDYDSSNNAEVLNYIKEINAIRSQVQQLRLRAYKNNDINGDLIVSQLTDDLADKFLLEDGDVIGFVGDVSSPAYLLLSRKFGDKVKAFQSTDVQGLEFKYVVVDRKLNFADDADDANGDPTGVKLYRFLKDLYTMMTRSKAGSIFIDPSGSISRITGDNRIEESKAQSPSIVESVKLFKDRKLKEIEMILDGLPTQQNQSGTLPPTAGTQPSTSIQPPTGRAQTLQYESELARNSKLSINNTTKPGFYKTYLTIRGDGTSRVPLVIEVKDDKVNFGYEKNGAFKPIEDHATELDEDNFEVKNDSGETETITLHPKSLYVKDGTLKCVNLDGNEYILSYNPYEFLSFDSIPNTKPTLNGSKVEKFVDEDEQELFDKSAPKDSDEDLQDDEDVPDDIYFTDSGMPIKCYSHGSLTGYVLDDNSGEYVLDDSYESEHRDLTIFTKGKKRLTKEEYNAYVKKLRELKQLFLYRQNFNDGKSYGGVLNNKDDVKFYVEVRSRVNGDKFISGTGLDEEKMTFNPHDENDSNGLVFSVVGVFTDKDDNECKFTLGLLNNPKTFKEYCQNPIKIKNRIIRLTKTLNESGTLSTKQRAVISDEISRLLEKVSRLTSLSDYNTYVQQLRILYDRAVNEGGYLLKRIPKVQFTGLTELRKTTSKGKLMKEMRLIRITVQQIKDLKNHVEYLKSFRNGLTKQRQLDLDKNIKFYEDKIEELEKTRESSFASLNRYTKRSDKLYIYAPESEMLGFDGIDDSIIGRYAEVLVTNEIDAKTDDTMMSTYLSQKDAVRRHRKVNGFVDPFNVLDEDGNLVVPSIRLAVLGNGGVRFSDLYDPAMIGLMLSESTVKKGGKTTTFKRMVPFKTHYMGARMYTALWNFRANLLNFKRIIDAHLNDSRLDQSYIDLVALYMDIEYYESLGKESPAPKEVINQIKLEYNSLTDENKALYRQVINDINKACNNNVKTFRLGGGLGKGVYIRQLDKGFSPDMYKSSEPNGIFCSIKQADKYLNLIDSLFTNVLDKIVKCSYSDESKKHHIMSSDKEAGNSIYNKVSDIVNTGSIFLNDADDGAIEYQLGSAYNDVNKSTSKALANIPSVLTKVAKFISMMLSHTSTETPFNQFGDYDITLKYKDDADNDLETKLEYEKIFDNLDGDYAFDTSLNDMFNLAFHGTLLDPIQLFDPANPKPDIKQAECPFPQGLKVDPMSAGERVTLNGKRMFYVCVTNPIFFTMDAFVDDPGFYFDMNEVMNYDESLDEEVDEEIGEDEGDNEVTWLSDERALQYNEVLLHMNETSVADLVANGEVENLEDVLNYIMNCVYGDSGSSKLEDAINSNNGETIVGVKVELDEDGNNILKPYSLYDVMLEAIKKVNPEIEKSTNVDGLTITKDSPTQFTVLSNSGQSYIINRIGGKRDLRNINISDFVGCKIVGTNIIPETMSTEKPYEAAFNLFKSLVSSSNKEVLPIINRINSLYDKFAGGTITSTQLKDELDSIYTLVSSASRTVKRILHNPLTTLRNNVNNQACDISALK